MAAISGQKTVTTAGTAVALGDQAINGPLIVRALPTNTGNMYVGNDGLGDVTNANGLVLDAGDEVQFDHVDNLSQIMVDSEVNGEKVAWIKPRL